jgi:hypothetical protein
LDIREKIKKEVDELFDHSGRILELVYDKDKPKDQIATDFAKRPYEYQSWYTRALPVIKQLLPDRLNEFEELYIGKSSRKEINASNYTISDFLMGLSITRGLSSEPVFDTKAVFLMKFQQQRAILQSAYSRIDSILSDITGVLRAELFDNEIEKSRELIKGGYLRASGTMASVVLEGHLSQVCKNHNITLPKKALHIYDYNEALKKDGIYDNPTWRLIQRYNDIRILCCHSKGREPTKEEVSELIDGVEKSIKTIF